MNPDDAGAFSNAVPSVLTLFLDAPLLVQLVIVVMLAALVWSLVVIAEKTFQYAKARREADKFEQVFWSGQALDELYQALSQRRNVGMAALFVAAMREWKRSTEGENRTPSMRPVTGVQGRVDKVMDVALTRDVERLGRRLTLLSIVASSAPLLGLFGLAWGLMAAFQAAGASGLATLATIAPGIAQGLLAAALGFLAAIPAKAFLSKLEAEAERYTARLGGFAGEFSAILSRQLDRAG
ncbi:MotA/TolQ/ExbB proton channel family protein [Methyloceanibacter sp.]|uniref:MotA/TolQ/ExbB proton channel family protein n=1 Tax=Methyloceanibacter sp. TaxID=1965321 RepID=UPI002BDEB2E8|nr:MotA/TolQ/ExbB proton channel family protein [Methyloceanibacter sp.]HML92887.1 MotA/TolQ/ExbB proton channel family protein [Methyloceanibacter sp.]